jgi:hypothetical protein
MSDTQDATPSSTEPIMTEAANDPNALAPAEASVTEAAIGEAPPNADEIVASVMETHQDLVSAEVAQPGEIVAVSAEAAPVDTSVTTSAETVASESILAAGEDPNAAVLPVVSLAESASASSATPASPIVDMPPVSASAGSGIRAYIANIKSHLIGFEQASVAKIHAELEAIERML